MQLREKRSRDGLDDRTEHDLTTTILELCSRFPPLDLLQISLENMNDDVERTGFDDARPDHLGSSDADVDDALEGESVRVEETFREEGRGGWIIVGGGESFGVFGEGTEGIPPGSGGEGGAFAFELSEVLVEKNGSAGCAAFENADESFEAAVEGEDFADAGRGGGEEGEMGEGVDEGERRGRGVDG